jgi:hypothetical protein
MSDEDLRKIIGMPLASEFESRMLESEPRFRKGDYMHELQLIRDAITTAMCLTIRIELEDRIHDETTRLMKLWGYSVYPFDTSEIGIYGYVIKPASAQRINHFC